MRTGGVAARGRLSGQSKQPYETRREEEKIGGPSEQIDDSRLTCRVGKEAVQLCRELFLVQRHYVDAVPWS